MDVDAAGAVVLSDRRLAAGRRLEMTGALKDKTQTTGSQWNISLFCREVNRGDKRDTDLVVGGDEVSLTVPVLWKGLQVLVKSNKDESDGTKGHVCPSVLVLTFTS